MICLQVPKETEMTLRRKKVGDRFFVCAHHFPEAAIVKFWSNPGVRKCWAIRLTQDMARQVYNLPLDDADIDDEGKYFLSAKKCINHSTDSDEYKGELLTQLFPHFLDDHPHLCEHIRQIFDRMFMHPSYSPLCDTDTNKGLVISVEAPYNRNPQINVKRGINIKQHFGKDKINLNNKNRNNSTMRSMYGRGCGISTNGTPPQ